MPRANIWARQLPPAGRRNSTVRREVLRPRARSSLPGRGPAPSRSRSGSRGGEMIGVWRRRCSWWSRL